MLETTLDLIFGINTKVENFTFLQICFRALLICTSALLMLRFAHKRFFAERNALDTLMAVILGSMLSRAINGPGELFGTIVASGMLVILHNVLTRIACRSDRLGFLLKGHSAVLVRDGRKDPNEMRRHHISDKDLEEDLRLKGIESLSEVKRATLERNGEISTIKASGAG